MKGCGKSDLPALVGSFANGNSPFGVWDMAGNVWEWTNDWYDANYYATAAIYDPVGPVNGIYKVVRGGGWNSTNVTVRSAERLGVEPQLSFKDVGFRCVANPSSSSAVISLPSGDHTPRTGCSGSVEGDLVCGGTTESGTWSISVACMTSSPTPMLVVTASFNGAGTLRSMKAGVGTNTWYGTENPGVPNSFLFTVPRVYITEAIEFSAELPDGTFNSHTDNLGPLAPATCGEVGNWSISVACMTGSPTPMLVVTASFTGGGTLRSMTAGDGTNTWSGSENPGLPNSFLFTVPRVYITENIQFSAELPDGTFNNHTENLGPLAPATCGTPPTEGWSITKPNCVDAGENVEFNINHPNGMDFTAFTARSGSINYDWGLVNPTQIYCTGATSFTPQPLIVNYSLTDGTSGSVTFDEFATTVPRTCPTPAPPPQFDCAAAYGSVEVNCIADSRCPYVNKTCVNR
jgi:hypothetical protein